MRIIDRKNKRIKIPGEGTEFARDYEDIQNHASDNEYLYYIHFRLGAANSTLLQIRSILVFIATAIAVLFFALWNKGVI
jgi:hypothetical protein